MDRTELDAAMPGLRKNDRHESTWNPHDVWLTRVRQPRELAARLAARLSPIESSGQPSE